MVVFGVGAAIVYWYGGVSKLERQWRWHRYYIAAGITDALNGLLIVYASFLGRVSGPLGAILINLNIPFTLLFSRLVGVGDRRFTCRQIIALLSILAAVVLGLLPLLIRLGKGQVHVHPQAWWWPLVYIAGCVPAALMQVVQDKCQDDFKEAVTQERLQQQQQQQQHSSPPIAPPGGVVSSSDHHPLVQPLVEESDIVQEDGQSSQSSIKRISVLWFQAWESIYQWLFFVIFCWVDLLPEFGFRTTWSGFWDAFTLNWRCLLSPSSVPSDYSNRCEYSAPLASVFIISYLLSYISSMELTNYASANTVATLSCVPPILSVLFWSVFPSINRWGGGDDMEALDIQCTVAALVPLVAGIVLWRRSEQVPHKAPDADETRTGIELCCRRRLSRIPTDADEEEQ